MSILEHQRPHGIPDADPQESGERVPDQRDRQRESCVAHIAAHHHFGHDVRLPRNSQSEQQIEREAREHAARSPGRGRFRIILHDLQRHAGEPALNGKAGRDEDQHGRNNHHASLKEIGINRSDDASHHTVKDQHSAREQQPDDQRIGPRQVIGFGNLFQNGGHRLELHRQVRDYSAENRDGRQQSDGSTSKPCRGNVGERNRTAGLGQQPQTFRQKKIGNAESDRRGCQNPERS